MDRQTLEQIGDLARSHGLVLFSDEVYRELEHDPGDRLPAACDLDDAGGLARKHLQDLRAARATPRVARNARPRDPRVIMRMKDYTTICSSAPSEVLVAVALRNRHVLTRRNLAIVERNLPLLDGFFERHRDTFEWVRPTASPIGVPARQRRRRRRRDVRAARRTWACCCCPARSTTSPPTCGSASAAPTCPTLCASSRRASGRRRPPDARAPLIYAPSRRS